MSQNKKRIEPSFSASSVDLSQQDEHHSHKNEMHQENESFSFNDKLNNIYLPKVTSLCKKIFKVINQNRKISLYVSSIVALVIIILILFYSGDNEQQEQQHEPPQTSSELNIFTGLNNTQYKVAFQDNFSLMITAYEGLIINWQGEHSESTVLWDIRRTTGNKTCQYMQLNSKERYRTLSVINDDMKGYLAYFSPLDSENIISSLARKNSFTLCGYEFSLKGSQTLLGKHNYYNNFLSE